MVYHPVTTKGNSGYSGQHFNFEPGEVNQKQQMVVQTMHQGSAVPNHKRATSVKHASQPQVLKADQIIPAGPSAQQQKQQQAAAQQSNARPRGASAQPAGPQSMMMAGQGKSKGAMFQSGSASLAQPAGQREQNGVNQMNGSG